ncbi:hypothetical protein Q4530_14180 [Colwellia sp. 1_MG-2023]|uniref:hypothetical protein n=1 Tax=unclassified Colwellia TaxID=196834 RepID=UPI001C09662E|nr:MULTISPECIES: hypothetical protein [unclassified Colwellia]MBU2925530.1 hypothetical protein [Colwellia sp. C2M11]MDO6651501.1 hypothetical protein [Colwellia sp. 3_MG-2023]MDO6667074.1 hypothetical protein [Colwellia sp. 2_MG-2023]MDO6690924.1 hypothetical protein [Colwellia sp. 1_MG-2023]
MKSIKTPSGRSEFSYQGNIEKGFKLKITDNEFFLPSELVNAVLTHFKGQLAIGGLT